MSRTTVLTKENVKMQDIHINFEEENMNRI